MLLIARILAWLKPTPCKHVMYPGDAKCLKCGARLES